MLKQTGTAIRTLGRSPIFAGTVVLSLAAAVALIFVALSVLAATFLKTSPYPHSDRIVELWPTASPASSMPAGYVHARRLEVWIADGMRSFAAVAGEGLGMPVVWRRSEGAVRVDIRPTLGDWFRVHAAAAERGRVLHLDDSRTAAAPAAVLSRRFAERYYPDANPIGTTMHLGARVYAVIGVMPNEFESSEVVWIPAMSIHESSRPTDYLVRARLADGASPAEAATEVRTLAQIQVAADSAGWDGRGATATAVGGVTGKVDAGVLALVVSMIVVVLIVCMINLITVFQLRSDSKRAEMAIRSALGASPRALRRMRTREGLMLGLIASVPGLTFGHWLVRILSGTVPGLAVSVADQNALPLAVAAAAAVILAPTLLSLRTIPHLHGDAPAAIRGDDTKRHRSRRVAIVSAQVAATVVLVSAMLAMISARNVFSRIPLGYDSDGIVQVTMDFEIGQVAPDYQWGAMEEVASRLTSLPNIDGLAMWRFVMQSYPATDAATPVIEGNDGPLPQMARLYSYYEITSGSLDALGVEMVAGRSFANADARDGLQAIVTKSAAIAWWGDERAALGKSIRLTRDSPPLTVIGVTGDIHRLGDMGRHLGASGRVLPHLFVRADQQSAIPVGWRVENCISCVGVTIGARPSAASRDFEGVLRAEIGRMLPGVPITSIGTITDRQATIGYGADIMRARVLLFVALGTGLLLVTIGVAGTVAQNVVQRRREIGIRVAVGASAVSIAFVVVREAALAAGAGIGGGIAIIFLGKEALERLFFAYAIQQMRVEVFTLSLVAVASTGILALVIIAALWPTRNALRVDPAVVLRSDA